jgi:hypothetical protein
MRIGASRFSSWILVWTLTLLATLVPSAARAQLLDTLSVRVSSEKSSYVRGDSLRLTLEVKNNGLAPVTVSFANGQRYDFTARNATGATVWTWSHGKTFDPRPSEMILAAGETVRYQETWTFASNGGGAVPDGDYTVSGIFLGEYVGKSGPKQSSKSIQYTTPDYLQVSFSTDKSAYHRGETALLTLSMTNTAPYPLEVSFGTTQYYDFTATDANGTTQWTWSTGRTFDPVAEVRTLAPGETWTVQESWAFVNDAGGGVLDGDFVVRGIFLGDYLGRSGLKQGEQTINLFTPDPIQVSFSTDKTTYSRLSPARLTLTLTNIASYPVTLYFPSEKRYDFSARDSLGRLVWTWSNGKTFPTVPSEVVLAPGASLSHTESWSFVQNNGLPVMDGPYTVRGNSFGQWYGETGSKSGERTITVGSL